MFEVKLIAHSMCAATQKEILTWELTYQRFIHGELMTHKMLSKNAASSRAIPVEKVIGMVRDNPSMPVHWGKNQPGMQASVELEGEELELAKELWLLGAQTAADVSQAMTDIGVHKQVANRVTEPYQWMKTVLTGTEWANFFWLRKDVDAQPEFRELAQKMYDIYEESVPNSLFRGDWHLPYYEGGFWTPDISHDNHSTVDIYGKTLKEAKDISMSCCAQVSYRVLDDTLEKAQRVVDRLNLGGHNNRPVHASPSEHQATPMEKSVREVVNYYKDLDTWQEGITAYHKELGFMSGNLAGFIQNRQLIPGHTRW